MSKVIATVWIAPSGPRWGVRYDDQWIIEDISLHVATAKALLVAAELRKTIPIVNIKTERPKKRGRWR